MPINLSDKTSYYIYIFLGLLVIAGGIALRIQNSEARILHSDEAVQAYQLWELMETGRYQYDPEDKHGPLLYRLNAIVNLFVGIDASEFNRSNLRLVPILSSVALLALFLFGSRKPHLASLLAAGFFALSPFPVIYGAYFIQEALFVLLGFILLYATLTYWSSPNGYKAMRCGLWAAAFFATKEPAIIHIVAILAATLAIQEKPFDYYALAERFRLQLIAIAIGAFAFGWVLFYSAAFTDFSQLIDSVAAFVNYAERSQGAGHEKSVFYYLSLFWPHTAEGIRWGEAPMVILGLVGFALLVINRANAPKSIQATVHYGAVCFILYSIIPYKTPWLMLTSYASLSVAVGYTFSTIVASRANQWIRYAGIGVALYLLGEQYQTTQLVKRYAADSRNPYIYQHTSSQFQKLVDRIEDIDALDPETQLSIAVGGEDNAWPLPWYLRENDTVGYWPDPAQMPALDIVIGPTGTLSPSLGDTHIPEYHGLRENVLLECWIRKELWDAFMETR